MSRRRVYLGSPLQSPVDIHEPSPAAPSWPDIDTTGALADAGIDQLAGARAITLGYDTDWDLVRVILTGGRRELLGPGRVLELGPTEQVARVEPTFKVPATRLYDASAQRRGLVAPTLPAGIKFTWDPGGGLNNSQSTAPFTLYKWVAGAGGVGAWTTIGAVAAGAAVTEPITVFDAATHRPADYSLDKVWNLADVTRNFLIPKTAGVPEDRPLYVSAVAFDNHGQPGDPTNPTTIRYPSLLNNSVFTFPNLDPRFYGKLSLDVFGDGDCIPRDAGALAPERFVSLALYIPSVTNTALLTIPVLNARGVELLTRNVGGNDMTLVLLSPHPSDQIYDVNGVPNVDPAPAVAAGAELSLVLESPKHPLLKIAIATTGLGDLAADTLLTIKRSVTR